MKAAASASGLKLTRQRLEIFKEIASRLDHPDADAVFAAVRERIPSVSLDTVYRTLWTLADLGVIATLGPRMERQRFDSNMERHHHFICERCGLVEDFMSEELDGIEIPLAAKRFGNVLSSQMEIRGICKECAKGEAVRPARE